MTVNDAGPERWIGKGDTTLDNLRRLSPTSRSLLLVRHSAREVGPPVSGGIFEEEWPLTPAGRVEARRFGRELPSFDRLTLTHTPKERTRDTAREVEAGFRERYPQAQVQWEGIDPGLSLTKFYARDRALRDRWVEKLGIDFYVGWLRGEIPDPVMVPASDAVHDLVRRTRAKMEASSASSLHLAVSHDVTLFLIREVLFGPGPDERPPIDYLDGILFTLDDDGEWVARWRDETVRRPEGEGARPEPRRNGVR
jgi:broad specificity phosphatase PhoE